MDQTVRLTINGEIKEFPVGISYKEVIKDYEKNKKNFILMYYSH